MVGVGSGSGVILGAGKKTSIKYVKEGLGYVFRQIKRDKNKTHQKGLTRKGTCLESAS